MSEFLKGNFKVKREVVEKEPEAVNEAQKLSEELKQRALTSLGGSMVYMERTNLIWDGDSDEQPAK